MQTTFAEPAMVMVTPYQPPQGAVGRTQSAPFDDGVDLTSGNYTAAVTDATVGGDASQVSLNRTYNSWSYGRDGAFGRGWTTLLDVGLQVISPGTDGAATVELTRPDGRRVRFAKDVTPAILMFQDYSGPLGGTDQFIWSEKTSTYVWTTPDQWSYQFDTAGRLLEVRRPDGTEITVQRSAAGVAERIEDETGVGLDIEWSTSGNLVTAVETDPVTPGGTDRLRWTYSYSGSMLTGVCDPRPAGERGCLAYTYRVMPTSGGGTARIGPLETAGTAAGTFTTLEYDMNTSWGPSVKKRWDGEGHQWTYGFSLHPCTDGTPGSCRKATVTQPNVAAERPDGSPAPVPVVFELDSHDRVIKRTDELGHSARWIYDQYGFLQQEIDENGIGEVYWRDADGRLKAHTQVREGSTQSFVTRWYGYASGLYEDDPRWGLATHVWDPRVDSTRPSGMATRTTYDAEGRVLSQRSPNVPSAPSGRVQTNTYHPDGVPGEGRLATTTDTAGRVTSYTYWPSGSLKAVTGPTGLRREYGYDGIGRLTSITEHSADHPAAGVTTTSTFDAVGNVVEVEGPLIENVVTGQSAATRVTREFDPARRLVEQTEHGVGGHADRTTQWTHFDGNGRPTRMVDPEGDVVETSWTWRGREHHVVLPEGVRIEHLYTATGLPTQTWSNDLRVSDMHELQSAIAYDPGGRMASSIDASGAKTDYTYWDDGLLRTATHVNYRPDPYATATEVRPLSELHYDLAGNVEIANLRGLTLTTDISYDMANMVTRTATGSRYTDYTYRPDGQVASVTDGDTQAGTSSSTTYGYGPLPAVAQTSVSVAVGGSASPLVTTQEWNDRGLMTATVAPGGRRVDHEYDLLGRLVRTLEPTRTVEAYGVAPANSRPTTETGYDEFGSVSHASAPDGGVTTYEYDRAGNQSSVTLPEYTPPGATGVLIPEHRTSYDPATRTRTTTDELLGTEVIEELDHLGRVIRQVDPPLDGSTAPGETTFTWDDSGRLTGAIGPEGSKVRHIYDNAGNLRETRVAERFGPSAGTHTTTFGYDGELDLRSITLPDGSTTTMDHNAFGEVTSTTAPTAGSGTITTGVTRDHAGRPLRTTDALGRVAEVVYDGAGRPTTTRDHQGATLLRTRTFGYDAAGDLTSITKPAPNPGGAPVTTTMAYDGGGNMTSLTEPGGITTSYGYDVMGREVRATDGNQNATWTTYTPWGDVASMVEPSTTTHPAVADRTFSSTYAAPGRPERDVAPGGVERTYSYDGMGNPTGVDATGADGDVSRTARWDRAGRVREVISDAGTDTFTWDDRGNLLGATGPAGTSSFAYDVNGRMTNRSDAAGSATFAYWPSGALKTSTASMTGSTETFTYDRAGQLTSIAYPQGTNRSFTYDGLGNPATDTLKTGTTTLAQQSWTWAPDGEHLRSSSLSPTTIAGAGVEIYGYDPAGRLSNTTRGSAVSWTTWDGAGNRLTDGTSSATYDQRNRVLTSTDPTGTSTYDWTARGTLASVDGPDGETVLEFDALDRLISEETPDGTDEMEWDGLDRLIAVDGQAHTYAGLERDPVAVAGQTYARDPGGTARAYRVGSGPGRFLRGNQRGDVAATFVPGATTPATDQAYSVFGVTTPDTDAPQVGYQGDWTTESGLVHMDSRFYDPDLGTFITRDNADLSPGPAAATNRYTYGAGNPATAVDPTGNKSMFISPCLRSFISRLGCLVGRMMRKNTMRKLGPTQRFGPPIRRGDPDKYDRRGDSGSGSSYGGSRGGGGTRPTRPVAPPRPVRPVWSAVAPTRPAPGGHLVPPSSGTNRPVVEVSDTLYRPSTPPVAQLLPVQGAVPPQIVLLDQSSGGGGGFDIGDVLDGVWDGITESPGDIISGLWGAIKEGWGMITDPGAAVDQIREALEGLDWGTVGELILDALGIEMEECEAEGYSYCIGKAIGGKLFELGIGAVIARIQDAVNLADRLRRNNGDDDDSDSDSGDDEETWDEELDDDDGGGGTGSSGAGYPSPEAVIDPNKWNYLFGRANPANPENARKSQDLQGHMDALGVPDTQEGYDMLSDHFQDALENGEVVDNERSDWGYRKTVRSEFTGPSGETRIFLTVWQREGDGRWKFVTTWGKNPR